ncbi:MAG: CvpA family protein [Melioribacteraceae bacterium]
MNYIDYILLGLLFVGFVLGFKDGLVRKLLGLGGLIAAIVLTINYSTSLGEELAPMFSDELYLAKIVSGFLIFFGTIFLVSIIKRMIHPADKVNKFINQVLGGLAGIIQIVFIISVFLLILNVLDFPSDEDKDESLLYSSVYGVVPSTLELITGPDFEAKGFLKDYMNSKNDSNKKTEVEQTEELPSDDKTNENTILNPDDTSISLDSLIN